MLDVDRGRYAAFCECYGHGFDGLAEPDLWGLIGRRRDSSPPICCLRATRHLPAPVLSRPRGGRTSFKSSSLETPGKSRSAVSVRRDHRFAVNPDRRRLPTFPRRTLGVGLSPAALALSGLNGVRQRPRAVPRVLRAADFRNASTRLSVVALREVTPVNPRE